VAPPEEPATVACVQCKAPLPKGSRFCPNCGASQTAAPKCVQMPEGIDSGDAFLPVLRLGPAGIRNF
jgi:predicted amidophosphoribosyltransferase